MFYATKYYTHTNNCSKLNKLCILYWEKTICSL